MPMLRQPAVRTFAAPRAPAPGARTLLLAAGALAATLAAGALVARDAGAQQAPKVSARTSAASNPAAETIDRASKAFRSARTVRATFEQTLQNPVTGSSSTTTGELLLARPNKVAVRFAGAGDRVVSDGRSLWVYLPSAAPGQVVKLPAKSRGSLGADLVGELLENPRARYSVTAAGAQTISGRATHGVLLEPKGEASQISRAIVWVDDADGAVRQLQLTDQNGLVRTLRMTSWVRNASVPADAFSFAVPSGVRVVDQSRVQGAR